VAFKARSTGLDRAASILGCRWCTADGATLRHPDVLFCETWSEPHKLLQKWVESLTSGGMGDQLLRGEEAYKRRSRGFARSREGRTSV